MLTVRKVLRLLGLFTISAASYAANNFIPVTDAMLENPDQDDWLMISRTYDAQRYSPLDDTNKVTVPSLTLAPELGPSPGHTGITVFALPEETRKIF